MPETSVLKKERVKLELLGVRFGRDSMKKCESMLIYFEDSQRVTTHVFKVIPSMEIETVEHSKYFWPNLPSKYLDLSKRVEVKKLR